MESHVLVVGDACVDLLVGLPDSRSGRSSPGALGPRIVGGGTGANTAVALARLGVGVEFGGAIGDDRYGRWLADDFRRERVGTRALVVRGDAFTSMVVVVVQESGERHPVLWPPDGWAHTLLRPDDVPDDLVRNARWLHTTGMCLREEPVSEAVLHAMRKAREWGVPVSLDLNLRIESSGLDERIRRTVGRAIELADVVLGHAHEEFAPLAGTDDLEKAASVIADRRRTVVMRRGADGASAFGPDGAVDARAFPVTVVNTVGAGDAFDGGFVAARLDGRSVRDALRWGNAVAALKIQGPDARALPSRTDVEALLSADLVR
ncbi:MAG: carbohydrate kinase family protein [Vicinamibacterales bacterium]